MQLINLEIKFHQSINFPIHTLLVTQYCLSAQNRYWHSEISCFCCSQTAEHKRCINDITCTETDELYQWYLMSTGSSDAFTYICRNDTLSGFIVAVYSLM